MEEKLASINYRQLLGDHLGTKANSNNLESAFVQNMDGSITQSHSEYLLNLTDIELSHERKLHPNFPVSESEQTQSHALLVSLQWLVTQTRVDGMVDAD